ncbi:hypothetical protein PHYBOEH_008698 [Phytophthora boehmeriae]|uniref:PexRD2 WYL domain-containing protein n=1 Tax=Phytophthora boehmeriae TaxID=109152 RepID=A0A8T1W2I8_9STRA|nr:hypothetical protein PHYBOEH_008698 [Phytophthora boehmeriae]
MRPSHLLVMIGAAVLVSSEALLTTTDSKQVKLSGVGVTSHQDSSQRLLRTHHAIDRDDEDGKDDEDDEDEERALTTSKMWTMKEKGMTATGYAKKLGIFSKMKSGMSPGEYMRFLNSHKYDKYRTYLNFLKENK